MAEQEKPLPTPPSTPFGRKKNFEQEDGKTPLMADQMAMAMAEGKLDEFLDREMPENEYAKKLTMMMMGMSGMMPSPDLMATTGKADDQENTGSPEGAPAAPQPPEDVLDAIQSGDVKGLMGMLYREHQKRMPDPETTLKTEGSQAVPSQPFADKEVIDELMKIASDNNLDMDWIIARALKLYMHEHRKTGRL